LGEVGRPYCLITIPATKKGEKTPNWLKRRLGSGGEANEKGWGGWGDGGGRMGLGVVLEGGGG